MTYLLCSNCGRELPKNAPACLHCGAQVATATGESPSVEDDDRRVLDRLSTALNPTYLVRRLIGRGGFCDVFEIYDHDLDRRLAVKVLRADLAWAPGMIERFEREARALAKLNHPNIPPLYFVGDHQGLVYFAMPFIEGRSLGDLVRLEGPIDPASVIEIMLPVLDALDHAHRHGIIHRDIKPDNVIIESAGARPLLVDFGLAKQMSARPGASLPGLILGTPAYSSPEQVLAQPGVDHRSDIYGIGSTMFHVLTGSTIVTGDNPAEVIGRQLTAEIPVPSSVNRRIPIWLSDVVLCALQRRPEDRFQSALAVAEALKAGGRIGPVRVTPVRHIRSDDPTPTMVPAAKRPSPEAGQSSPQRLRRQEDLATRQRRWGRRLGWTLATVVLCLVVTWLFLVPINFVLSNRLILPVEIHTQDGGRRIIAPGGAYRVSVRSDERILVTWQVVQPIAEEGRPPIGDPLEGVVRIESITLVDVLRKAIPRQIESRTASQQSFAPHIVNQTAGPLRVRIDSTRRFTEFPIAPYESRTLGYFRLTDGSQVEVFDAGGHRSVFADLEQRLDPASGALLLTISDSTLDVEADQLKPEARSSR